MKSATIPPLHVTPALRQDAQNVLKEGETLSSFVEEALRKQIESRKFHQEFIARGLAAHDRTTNSELPLAQLQNGVTTENLHSEIETGMSVGQEIIHDEFQQNQTHPPTNPHRSCAS